MTKIVVLKETGFYIGNHIPQCKLVIMKLQFRQIFCKLGFMVTKSDLEAKKNFSWLRKRISNWQWAFLGYEFWFWSQENIFLVS